MAEPAARILASWPWFLRSQNRTSICCLGPCWPSQMIEFVFAASPETIRREPQEITLHRSVGDLQDLAACALCNPVVFSLEGAVYATAVLKFSVGTNGRCPRSTASR